MAFNSDLVNILESLDIPVVVGGWCDDEIAQFPCVEYHKLAPNIQYGGNSNYQTSDRWLVSIYAKQSDNFTFWNLCEKFENLLKDYSIAFSNSGDLFSDGLISNQFNFTLMRD